MHDLLPKTLEHLLKPCSFYERKSGLLEVSSENSLLKQEYYVALAGGRIVGRGANALIVARATHIVGVSLIRKSPRVEPASTDSKCTGSEAKSVNRAAVN